MDLSYIYTNTLDLSQNCAYKHRLSKTKRGDGINALPHLTSTTLGDATIKTNLLLQLEHGSCVTMRTQNKSALRHGILLSSPLEGPSVIKPTYLYAILRIHICSCYYAHPIAKAGLIKPDIRSNRLNESLARNTAHHVKLGKSWSM